MTEASAFRATIELGGKTATGIEVSIAPAAASRPPRLPHGGSSDQVRTTSMIRDACASAYCLFRARPAGIEPATVELEDVPTPPPVASTCGYGRVPGVSGCSERRE
jgi:hypothetical protein